MTALSVCFHHFCGFIKKSYQLHQCTILPTVDSAGNATLRPGRISLRLMKGQWMATFAYAEGRFIFVHLAQCFIHVSMALNALSLYV